MGSCILSLSISVGRVCYFTLDLIRVAYENYAEGAKGEYGDITNPTVSSTTVPTTSMLPTPSTLSTAVPTSQQHGKSKKRSFLYTEDSSDDEDVDMDIDSNNSSGSSMDSDHVPAKRLRSATIITRSSTTTPAPSGVPAGPDVHQDSPSSAGYRSLSVGDLNTEAETEHETEREPGSETGSEFGPETGSEVGPETETELGTEPETDPDIPGDTRKSSPGAQTNQTEHATTSTTSTLHHSPAVDINIVVNGSSTGLRTGNIASTSAKRVRKPVGTPVAPSQPPLPLPAPDPSEVPAFLFGKYDVYAYLSSVNETGFRSLLKVYISFELADRSCIRSSHSTTHRPAAIGWWTSRARPNRSPPYDSLKSFTKSITKWWISLQPHWRKIKPGTVSRIEGDWEFIYKPGVNGFLNVVILAYWWARILGERGCDVDATYSWFVSDVEWVLSQLTIAAREGVF